MPGCQWCAEFKFRVRGIPRPQVLDPRTVRK